MAFGLTLNTWEVMSLIILTIKLISQVMRVSDLSTVSAEQLLSRYENREIYTEPAMCAGLQNEAEL